jgi:hypothetical protein
VAANPKLDAPDEWAASVATGDDHVMLSYTCPRCRTPCQINVQTPTRRAPTETKVWCHRCQLGAPATVTAG